MINHFTIFQKLPKDIPQVPLPQSQPYPSLSMAQVRSCTVAECMILPPTSAAVPIVRARLPADIVRLERREQEELPWEPGKLLRSLGVVVVVVVRFSPRFLGHVFGRFE